MGIRTNVSRIIIFITSIAGFCLIFVIRTSEVHMHRGHGNHRIINDRMEKSVKGRQFMHNVL